MTRYIGAIAGCACLAVGLFASANGWTFVDWLMGAVGGFTLALAISR